MEENNVQTKLHEKKWFLPVLFVVIILSNIIGVAIMMAMPMFTFKMGGALMSKTTSSEKAEKINLKELKLGSRLGRLPKGNKGQISSNNEKELILNIPNITPKDYEEYIKQCRKNFNIDERLVSGSFEAYDKDNYRLMLEYYEQRKTLKIYVISPRKNPEIKWPNTELAKTIPEIKSKSGIVGRTNQKELQLTIQNTTKADFAEYIERCKAAGYNLNSDQKEDSYFAKDAQGNTLSLKYRSGREMSIIVIKRTAITSSNNKENQVNKVSTNNAVAPNDATNSTTNNAISNSANNNNINKSIPNNIVKQENNL